MTGVEPDARMAAVLAARFPDVEVVVTRFAQWSPPPGGVPLLACALACTGSIRPPATGRPTTRLTPGGTLAVFAHRYDYVDPAHSAAVRAAFESVDPVPHHDQPEDWFHADITASGLFTDVRSVAFRRPVPLTTAGTSGSSTPSPAAAPPTGAAGPGPRGDRRRRRRLRRHRHPRPADHAGAGPPASLKNRWAGRVDPAAAPFDLGVRGSTRRPDSEETTMQVHADHAGARTSPWRR